MNGNETRRDNVHIEVEKIGERVNACKNYPLAGPCRLVHCHYKCTVSFDERYWTGYPVPISHVEHKVEVVSFEKNALYRCTGPDHSTTAPGHGE